MMISLLEFVEKLDKKTTVKLSIKSKISGNLVTDTFTVNDILTLPFAKYDVVDEHKDNDIQYITCERVV